MAAADKSGVANVKLDAKVEAEVEDKTETTSIRPNGVQTKKETEGDGGR